MFIENQHDRVERVLRKELGTPDDHGDKADRIDGKRGQFLPGAATENGPYRSHAQTRESHGQAARQAGEG